MVKEASPIFTKPWIVWGGLAAVGIAALTSYIALEDHASWKALVLLGLMFCSSIAFGFVVYYDRWISLRSSKRLWIEKLGVVNVFRNRDVCEEEIKDSFKRASHCKVFILRGMSDFSGDKSLFYTLSMDDKESIRIKQKKDGGYVRVLIASTNSKFISPDKYRLSTKLRDVSKTKASRSITDIGNVIKILDRIKTTINLSYRFYDDAFLCKFYLFDNDGFVAFNDRLTKIDQNTSMLRIRRVTEDDNGEDGNAERISIGLFAALERYFDYLWDLQSSDSEEKAK